MASLHILHSNVQVQTKQPAASMLWLTSSQAGQNRWTLPLLKLHFLPYSARILIAINPEQAAALQGGQSNTVARPA